MKLKFYLLWFENEPEWVESKIDTIKEIVEEYGFEWTQPNICKKKEEFSGDYNDYDIILMDYKLVNGNTEGQTGANIIEKIRSSECFTNILFYSQNGEDDLRKEISLKNLDGVFCVNRGDFIEKFEKLFINNIKKIEDVNNLRGLVMAETADLEKVKEEIIELYDSINCSHKKGITKKVILNMVDSNNKGKTFLDSKNEDTPFEELLDYLDLHKKSIIIHRINNRTSPLCEFNHKEFNENIIVKRNLLAHVREKIVEDASGRRIILESEKNGDKLIFSQSEAKKIRIDISKYRDELEKLRAFLVSQLG